MIRRLGVFWSTGALLATALVALSTVGMSAAHAVSFEDWDAVDGGGSHTCGIRHGGKLYCWGRNVEGELGDGAATAEPVTTPSRVGAFEDWATISAGGSHNCGVRKNGKLYCWGYDIDGQVGNGGNNDEAISSPQRIGTFEDWANVSAGSFHTCGVRLNGKLYCWGKDASGQIGDGDGTDSVTTPRRIGTFEDWGTVTAGQYSSCGVRKNGKLYCWGFDNHGQIGDGDTPGSATSPRRIGTFEDWADASAGTEHTCGIRRSGKLYCWGLDGDGQVGDGGPADDVTVPHRIGTFEDWAAVSAGFAHTCGVRSNGKLYCWGTDIVGQIGDGDDDSPDITPQRVGTFEDWVNASAGGSHSCGVRSNGKLYCWGTDYNGQIGDGEPLAMVKAPQRI